MNSTNQPVPASSWALDEVPAEDRVLASQALPRLVRATDWARSSTLGRVVGALETVLAFIAAAVAVIFVGLDQPAWLAETGSVIIERASSWLNGTLGVEWAAGIRTALLGSLAS